MHAAVPGLSDSQSRWVLCKRSSSLSSFLFLPSSEVCLSNISWTARARGAEREGEHEATRATNLFVHLDAVRVARGHRRAAEHAREARERTRVGRLDRGV